MKKEIFHKIETIIDHKTGEITHEKKTIIRRGNIDGFAQVYFNGMEQLAIMCRGIELNVLLLIIKTCISNKEGDNTGNYVIITPTLKQKWATMINCSSGHIANTISSLLKKKFYLKREDQFYS